MSLEDFHTIFDFYGWNTRDVIVGKTSQEYNAKRGTQIEQWLQEYSKPGNNYCIIDDDSDMLPSQEEHFVKVDYNDGLSFANITQMHTIFGVPLREL